MTDEHLQLASLDLAKVLECDVTGHDAAIVILACCWVLASITMQAHVERAVPLDDSLDIVRRHLDLCVERLRELQLVDGAQPVVAH
jgi:uncharacterized membrane protein